MGRPHRKIAVGALAHLNNRSVERRTIFHSAGDYWAFVDLLQEAAPKGLVSIFGYNVMPNHWHILLTPLVEDGASKFAHWLTTTHVRRYRRFHGTEGCGHLYGKRFHDSIIPGRISFVRVLRYIEANAANAGLTERAEDWPWCSAFERRKRHRDILSAPPYPLPEQWSTMLSQYVAKCRRRRSRSRQ